MSHPFSFSRPTIRIRHENFSKMSRSIVSPPSARNSANGSARTAELSHGTPHKASRDMLLSIIIHSLAEELSDVRVRAQIQASLSELGREKSRFYLE